MQSRCAPVVVVAAALAGLAFAIADAAAEPTLPPPGLVLLSTVEAGGGAEIEVWHDPALSYGEIRLDGVPVLGRLNVDSIRLGATAAHEGSGLVAVVVSRDRSVACAETYDVLWRARGQLWPVVTTLGACPVAAGAQRASDAVWAVVAEPPGRASKALALVRGRPREIELPDGSCLVEAARRGDRAPLAADCEAALREALK